jgi:hypothetical protein
VIGKLNFLEKSTRGDISYPVHQCARFSVNLKESHGEAVKRIGRYLMGTLDKGIILNPTEDSFECYVDADFCGNWNANTASEDAGTAKSRTGYVIKYAGCPITLAIQIANGGGPQHDRSGIRGIVNGPQGRDIPYVSVVEARDHGIANVVSHRNHTL